MTIFDLGLKNIDRAYSPILLATKTRYRGCRFFLNMGTVLILSLPAHQELVKPQLYCASHVFF